MFQSVTGVQNVALPLRALAALCDPAGDDRELLSAIIKSLRDVFIFDQALALVEAPEGWQCAMSFPGGFPDPPAALTWQRGPFFDELAAGRVAAHLANHDFEEWSRFEDAAISPLQPALYIPIRVRD